MPSSASDWSSDVCSSDRSEEHTSELQSLAYLVCRLLLEKKKTTAAALLARTPPTRAQDQVWKETAAPRLASIDATGRKPSATPQILGSRYYANLDAHPE